MLSRDQVSECARDLLPQLRACSGTDGFDDQVCTIAERLGIPREVFDGLVDGGALVGVEKVLAGRELLRTMRSVYATGMLLGLAFGRRAAADDLEEMSR